MMWRRGSFIGTNVDSLRGCLFIVFVIFFINF
jgi:hypothetical protein